MQRFVEFGLRIRSGLIEANLRNQPLIHEYWLAEDAALEQVFTSLEDPALTERVQIITNQSFSRLQTERRIPRDQEKKWRELCTRNARRMIWQVDPDLSDEMAPLFARVWEAGMRRIGVFDKFTEYYVKDGKSIFISIAPDRPYF